MDTDLPLDTDRESIRLALLSCSVGDVVRCPSEVIFSQAKILLVKEKITGITIQLLDSDGYVARQIVGKKRSEVEQGEFNDRQLSIIKALEKVFKHCEQEGIKLVGYSDELVAYPAKCKDLVQASVFALDIDTADTYSGADPGAELLGPES